MRVYTNQCRISALGCQSDPATWAFLYTKQTTWVRLQHCTGSRRTAPYSVTALNTTEHTATYCSAWRARYEHQCQPSSIPYLVLEYLLEGVEDHCQPDVHHRAQLHPTCNHNYAVSFPYSSLPRGNSTFQEKLSPGIRSTRSNLSLVFSPSRSHSSIYWGPQSLQTSTAARPAIPTFVILTTPGSVLSLSRLCLWSTASFLRLHTQASQRASGTKQEARQQVRMHTGRAYQQSSSFAIMTPLRSKSGTK